MRNSLIILAFLFLSDMIYAANGKKALDKENELRVYTSVGLSHNKYFKEPNLKSDTNFTFNPVSSYFYNKPTFGSYFSIKTSKSIYRSFGISVGILYMNSSSRIIQDSGAARYNQRFFMDPALEIRSNYKSFFIPFSIVYTRSKYVIHLGYLLSLYRAGDVEYFTLNGNNFKYKESFKYRNFKKSFILSSNIKLYKDFYLNLTYLPNADVIDTNYAIGLTYSIF